MEERIGDWVQTYTGKHFYPMDVRDEDVSIIDIAHALSMICRFNGHTSVFYSVGEHCWRMSYEVPKEDSLWALLHDAAEAYIGDFPRPIKNMRGFEAFKECERRIMDVIIRKYDLQNEEPESVKYFDLAMLMTEARDFMNDPHDWSTKMKPLPNKIWPCTQPEVVKLYLDRFYELTPNGGEKR